MLGCVVRGLGLDLRLRISGFVVSPGNKFFHLYLNMGTCTEMETQMKTARSLQTSRLSSRGGECPNSS